MAKEAQVAHMEGEEEAWVPNTVDSVVSRAEARKGRRLSCLCRLQDEDAPRELGESCRVCLSEKPSLWGTSGWAFPATLGLLQSQAARREGAPCGSPECRRP
ncbi:hypothetical protein CapIbe_014866 [Capra ibex]